MAGSIQRVKYTTVLPAECVDELKDLAARKIIPSVNSGIRLAVQRFISQSRRELYEREMKEAAKDREFMKRTLESQSEFSCSDSEVGGDW